VDDVEVGIATEGADSGEEIGPIAAGAEGFDGGVEPRAEVVGEVVGGARGLEFGGVIYEMEHPRHWGGR